VPCQPAREGSERYASHRQSCHAAALTEPTRCYGRSARVWRSNVKPLVFATVIWLAGAGVASPQSSAVRIWLFTPVLPDAARPGLAARPLETTTRLAKALRGNPRVALVDNIDEANVIVQVGAAQRKTFGADGEKVTDNITLTVNGGQAHGVLQATARRARDAEADAVRQLLAWVQEHAAVLEAEGSQ
jgi:hypothetical protein